MKKILLFIVLGVYLLFQLESFAFENLSGKFSFADKYELPYDWNKNYSEDLSLYYGCPHKYEDESNEKRIQIKNEYEKGYVVIRFGLAWRVQNTFTKLSNFLSEIDVERSVLQIEEKSMELILYDGQESDTDYYSQAIAVVDGYLCTIIGYSTSPIYAKNYLNKELENFSTFLKSIELTESSYEEIEFELKFLPI